MRPLLMSFTRVMPSEALVIRSLVRVSEDVLTHDWRFGREEDHCDLRLVGSPSESARKHHRLRVESVHFHPSFNQGLAFPPMDGSLVRLMNDVAARFERTAFEARRLFQWTPPHAAMDILERVAELHAGSYALEFEGGAVLAASFDGQHSRLALPATMTFKDLQKEIRARSRIRLQLSQTPMEVMARSCPLTTLLMLLANAAEHPALRQALARAVWLSLAAWPDFGLLGGEAALLKLSAAMMHRPMRRDQLIEQSGLDLARLYAFLNACSYAGILRTSSDIHRPPAGDRRPADAAGEPVFLPGLGLFSRIRLALGIPG